MLSLYTMEKTLFVSSHAKGGVHVQGSRNKGGGAPWFATFNEFLKYAGNEDRQYLLDKRGWERRFTEAACGMANIAGGWIILGAEEPEEGPTLPVLVQEELPAIPGLSDPERVQASVVNLLSEACSTPFRAWTQFLSEERLLLVRVEPAVWHDRPVCVRRSHTLDYTRGSYRRIEGVDVASGLRTRFLLGMDSLDRLRDDRPIPGSKAQDLDAQSLAAFRDQVVSLRRSWARLAQEAFLSRTLVLSGSEVTEAGRLLLGQEATVVHVSLHGGGALDVPNLWRACALLPRLTRSLSPACGMAFRECFLNALLHADYSAGGVTVELSEGPSGQIEARLENFGLVRDMEVPLCRNFRLMRIFQLMGLARGEGTGLKLIRRYSPLFHLKQDSLELRTTAVLPLEPAEGIEDMPERSHSEMPLLLAAAPLFSSETEPGKTPEPEPVPMPEVSQTASSREPVGFAALCRSAVSEQSAGRSAEAIPEPEPIVPSEPELEKTPEPEPVMSSEPELEKTPEPEPVMSSEPELEETPEPEPVMSSEPDLEETPEPGPTSEPEVIPEPEPVVPQEPEGTPEPTPEQLLFGEDHVVSLEEQILMEQVKALSENEQIQRISEMMDERAGDGVGREQKEGIDRPARGLFGSAEDDLRRAIEEMREAEGERARAAGRNGSR